MLCQGGWSRWTPHKYSSARKANKKKEKFPRLVTSAACSYSLWMFFCVLFWFVVFAFKCTTVQVGRPPFCAFKCISVRVASPACLSACLPACLPACLLPACLPSASYLMDDLQAAIQAGEQTGTNRIRMANLQKSISLWRSSFGTQ